MYYTCIRNGIPPVAISYTHIQGSPTLHTHHSLSIEVSEHGDNDAAQGHHGQLVAGAHQTHKGDGVRRGAEHIPMHLLPAVLVSQVPLL